ncbi:hypothetical protein Tco_0884813 [Tanacetum coccineum]
MILESVEHGPLIWPMIEENGVIRTKKYDELSATEKIQADCDMKETNIILQGLPSDIYSLVNHHRVAKDLWERIQLLMQDLHTTNFDQLHAYLQQHELHANEVRIMRERNQDPLALCSPSQSPQYWPIHPTQHYSTTYSSAPRAITYPTTPYPNAYSSIVHQEAYPQPQSVPQIEYIVFTINQQTHLAEFPQVDSGLAVPVFKQGDDPIDSINKMMSFLSTIVTSCFLSTNNQLRNSSNPRQQATIHDGKIRFNVLSKVPHSDNTNNDMLNQSVQEMTYSKQTHLVNYPENEITSDSNIIPHSQYLLETQNAAVRDTYSSAQQDAIILSVFEQLTNQRILENVLFHNKNCLLNMLSGFKCPTLPLILFDRITPAKNMELPSELPKVSLVNTSLKKLKFHLAQFDSVVKKRITPDALSEGEWGIECPCHITTLKNDIRKLKGKDVVDNVAQVSNATTIAPGMYKIDPGDPLDSASYTAFGDACPLTSITATNKKPLRVPILLDEVAQDPVVTKVYTRRPKVPKAISSNSKPKIAKSMISNKEEPGTSWGSNTPVAPYSSLIDYRLSNSFVYLDVI